jgi:inward rectifier potassium channel
MVWPFRKRPLSVDEFEVVGAAKSGVDVYDLLLRTHWGVGLSLIVIAFLGVNVVFAVAYALEGGVAGARPHSFSDAFFFSVQTLGTLGYGAMYPVTLGAHVLVTLEVMLGVFILALATGVIFSKFSSVRARVRFADHLAIGPWNGVPTLMLRLGNERKSRVIDASIRLILMRTEPTSEGVVFYKMSDLPLERDRNPTLARSWTVMHRITESSPLWKATPESLAAAEAEFLVTMTGLDETSAQTLHARGRYVFSSVTWGARHADILSERADGGVRVDLGRFNELIPTKPIPDFPYPSA